MPEEQGIIRLNVIRTQGVVGAVNVEWRTIDGTAISVGKSPPDYVVSRNILISTLGDVMREHSVKTPNADYCNFHMEILYVDIYKFVTCSMNIL